MAKAYQCKKCRTYLRKDHGWDLCGDCYRLSKQGKIVRTRYGWKEVLEGQSAEPDMIYEKKGNIQSPQEIYYYKAITEALPSELQVLPQVALSAVVKRTDGSPYQNELNRVFDFLVVDKYYKPCFAIELNDWSHESNERKQRDINLRGICAEAGLCLEIFKPGMSILEINERVNKIVEGAKQTKRKPFIQKIVTKTTTANEPMLRRESTTGTQRWREWPPKRKYNWGVTLICAIFLGWFGVHRFYVDRMATGTLYAFTFGVFGVGWIIDVIRILTGNFTDKDGRKINRKTK